jgi:hypothetical protein
MTAPNRHIYLCTEKDMMTVAAVEGKTIRRASSLMLV